MGSIGRQNIFNLLGNDNRKYHSCYITTYSFDFLFFEERVLPVLKKAGITNVNLFVDGKIFQQKISDSSEINQNSKRGYSITAIEMNGAFHPKLFLAVGKKKGLLAIGSGNLTSSGINGNEEVWSSFHFSEGEDNKADSFFAKAKEYIIELSKYSHGFNVEKLNWLSSNAKWFDDLNDQLEPIIDYNDLRFEMLTSNADASFYKSLIDRLPKNPNTIKILAPYHNKNGQIIQNLLDDFNPNRIHCIIDPIFGTIPYEMVPNDKVQFSDWNELEKDSNIRRLHAKIFQFEYENQTYLVFGSANASVEAFGSKSIKGTNAEAIILVSSKTPLDWFTDLGINFPDTGLFDLSNYTPSKDDSEREIGFNNCLSYAEVEGTNFLLTLREAITDETLELVLMDSLENILYRSKASFEKSPVIFVLPDVATKGLFKATLYKDDKRFSNYVFIHRVDLIRSTNPDTDQERINAIINSETFSDLELNELLEYVNFNRLSNSSIKTDKKIYQPEHIGGQQIPDAISTEEFNKNEGVIEVKNAINSELEILEEFLFELSQGVKEKQSEDFSESEEMLAIESKDDGGLSDDGFQIRTGKQRVSFAQGIRLQHKLERIINELSSKFKEHKTLHLRAWKMNETYDKNANLEDLKSILVGVHLILIKKNDCFYENRSIVRIRIIQRYSKRTVQIGDKLVKIETMNLLENLEKQFKLQRYEGLDKKTFEEVTYTVNENFVEKLETELKFIPELKLVYKDESPSQLIDHHYFNATIWRNNKNSKGVQYFLLEGLASFLRLVNNEETEFGELELLKWKRYKRRLLFQSIVIVESFQWTREGEEFRDLFELNLFYSLVSNELSVSEFTEDLFIAISKARDKGYEREINSIRIIESYTKYVKWIAVYKNDPKLLKKKLDFRCINEIIFNKSLGFARIDHVSKDYRLNLISPLGSYNSERDLYGFVDVVIGATPCFY